MAASTLLTGTEHASDPEPLAAHVARYGHLPPVRADLIDELERSGLRGRGGASFSVAAKWRSVAAGRHPVILVNGAEGEPLSHKDRTLMRLRPHLVLDGAAIAAHVLGAREVLVYVGEAHTAAVAAMERAIAERPARDAASVQLLRAPEAYVSGEESAAVHFVNDGIALPTTVPPRPYQRGVRGRATLVQNVETLAHVALIARNGAAWFRSLGSGAAPGTALVTVSGAVPATVVREVAQGSTVTDAVNLAGGITEDAGAVLVGGYFGSWVDAPTAWGLALDASALRAHGLSLGCGVVGVMPASRCGVATTARIVTYLANESARQCGPCVFGLRAIASSMSGIASLTARHEELLRVQRWAGLLPGRGACHHPDGAATLVASALRVFAGEFELHTRHGRCSAAGAARSAA